MNITILAISTLIVLIVFGIPVATHPQWFKSVEEEIEEAKREGHIVTAKPVKIEHISKNRRDDIEEPHRYIVTYEYEYNGKTYASFDELKAATYEDVGEAKSYWLVWNCDGYTLAAECYDQFDGKETPQETSVTSICVFPDADESYISHVDAGSVVDGYVGCGEAPLCLSGIKTEG